MAQKLEFSNTAATSLVTASSRYAHSRVILLGERGVPAFALYKRDKDKMLVKDVQWSEITPSVEFRPDLVSYELYGTPDFWWKLLEINHMTDIMDFKAGRVIMTPDTMIP